MFRVRGFFKHSHHRFDGFNLDVQFSPFHDAFVAAGGSETPGMVRKVLAWRQDSSSNSELIWSALGELNDSVATLFTQLCELEKSNPPQYSATIDSFCRSQASEVTFAFHTLSMFSFCNISHVFAF